MPRLPTIHPGKSVLLHSDPRSLALYKHLRACGVLAVMRGRNGDGRVTRDQFARKHPDPREPAGYSLEIQFKDGWGRPKVVQVPAEIPEDRDKD